MPRRCLSLVKSVVSQSEVKLNKSQGIPRLQGSQGLDGGHLGLKELDFVTSLAL